MEIELWKIRSKQIGQEKNSFIDKEFVEFVIQLSCICVLKKARESLKSILKY
jgi:hypothetical protein